MTPPEPCDDCPFIACRDCRWQGDTDPREET